jgi:hypothetical protein
LPVKRGVGNDDEDLDQAEAETGGQGEICFPLPPETPSGGGGKQQTVERPFHAVSSRPSCLRR